MRSIFTAQTASFWVLYLARQFDDGQNLMWNGTQETEIWQLFYILFGFSFFLLINLKLIEHLQWVTVRVCILCQLITLALFTHETQNLIQNPFYGPSLSRLFNLCHHFTPFNTRTLSFFCLTFSVFEFEFLILISVKERLIWETVHSWLPSKACQW